MPKKGTTIKYKRRVGVNLGKLKKEGFAYDPPIPEDQFEGNVEALRQFKLEYKPDGTGRKKQMKGVLKDLKTGRLYLADDERYREFTDDEYSYIVKEIGESKQLGDEEKRIGRDYKQRTKEVEEVIESEEEEEEEEESDDDVRSIDADDLQLFSFEDNAYFFIEGEWIDINGYPLDDDDVDEERILNELKKMWPSTEAGQTLFAKDLIKITKWDSENPITLNTYDKLFRREDEYVVDDDALSLAEESVKISGVNTFQFYPNLEGDGTSGFPDFRRRLEDIAWVLLQPTTFNPANNPETGLPDIGSSAAGEDTDKFGTIIAEEDKFFMEVDSDYIGAAEGKNDGEEYMAVGLRAMIGHQRVHIVELNDGNNNQGQGTGDMLRIFHFPDKYELFNPTDDEAFFITTEMMGGEDGSVKFDEDAREVYIDYGVGTSGDLLPLPFKVPERNKNLANEIGKILFEEYFSSFFVTNLIGDDDDNEEARFLYGLSLVDLDEESQTVLDILVDEILNEDISQNLLEEKASIADKKEKPKMTGKAVLTGKKVTVKKKKGKPRTEKQLAALAAMREKAAIKRAAKKKELEDKK